MDDEVERILRDLDQLGACMTAAETVHVQAVMRTALARHEREGGSILFHVARVHRDRSRPPGPSQTPFFALWRYLFECDDATTTPPPLSRPGLVLGCPLGARLVPVDVRALV